MQKINLKDKILPAFYKSWRMADNVTTIVEKGGRASGKSSFIPQKIATIMMQEKVNCLVVRKVQNTLHDSVREQCIWALKNLGVDQAWQYTTVAQGAPPITYKPQGNQIIFRGADDPMKLKSLASSEAPYTILWIEEAAEFQSEHEIDIIIDTIVREETGHKYHIFISYNPPAAKHHWLNQKYNTHNIPADTFVHQSDYRDNSYLSQQYLERIEETRLKQPNKYRWMYLGEAIGAGVVPFSNLEVREITQQEINNFDNLSEGLDWGYANDPLAWVKMHFDKTRRILYIYDEIFGIQIGNRDIATRLLQKTQATVIADSAEPKSIDEVGGYGVGICGCKKGPGSIEHGIKWLDELEQIVIDPKRCPNTAREFESADYDLDRNGNPTNKLKPYDDHTIDAVRYGSQRFYWQSDNRVPQRRTVVQEFFNQPMPSESLVDDSFIDMGV